MKKLQSSFSGITIVEVPVVFNDSSSGGIVSLWGINLNSLLTYNNIYVPVFIMNHDAETLNTIRNNTTKNVISINETGVCYMGIGVRCLA
ncbi:MAG: hypothetical protein HRT68_10200 [Flavobacteriaceae bacterium]|nr:hypothetical protein [Flavobacteriaceae bacterium]